MLPSLNKDFALLASQPPATKSRLKQLKERFPSIPDEYLALATEATDIEIQHVSGQYLRIWGPFWCLDMDEGYGISKWIPGAIPFGDDGGGKVIFYMSGKEGFGLYHVGYGDLDAEDVIFTAPSLSALLGQAIGVDTF